MSDLPPAAAKKINPMFDEVLREYGAKIHSIHIVGSAAMSDYNEKLSDVNSVIVLHTMDLKFIEFLAPLGRKYGKKGVAAPLVMTPEYIRDSLDTFPVEFHDFKLIHRTIYGQDLFRELNIAGRHLRLQCERELKSKLIGLRQGYLSSLGKRRELTAVLIRSFTGSMALFRAIITLLGKEPPVPRTDVITAITTATCTGTGVYEKILLLRARSIKPTEQDLRSMFELYYNALEATGKIIDELRS
jgi:predicted nucleotidyltransferase